MKILIIIIVSILIVFGLSHLLDLPYITGNWLRYSVVIMAVIVVFLVAAKWVYLEIKGTP